MANSEKPHVIELLETFVKAEHKLGKSRDELISQMSEAVNFWVDSELTPELDSGIERSAINRLGGAIIEKAVTRHVDEILNS